MRITRNGEAARASNSGRADAADVLEAISDVFIRRQNAGTCGGGFIIGRMHSWPRLLWSEWADTARTLHLWTQVAGKIRMQYAPSVNHWWHVTLYVTPRGMSTGTIPCGLRSFSLDFDFVNHRFEAIASDGRTAGFALEPMSVAAFYSRTRELLASLDIDVSIWTTPSEIESPVPFEQDETHASYDAHAAHEFWHALVHVDRVFQNFRASFLGKVSPVHFFWGSFDLAVTRFSGAIAPEHPGVPILPDWITREAYSHEVSSAGFWPGGPAMEAMFYSYAYPTPEGFSDEPVRPADAFFSKDFGEFILPYEAVRTAADPEATLTEFLETTYAAAAKLLKWDRAALERRTPERAGTT
jgi:hypothetical protein